MAASCSAVCRGERLGWTPVDGGFEAGAATGVLGPPRLTAGALPVSWCAFGVGLRTRFVWLVILLFSDLGLGALPDVSANKLAATQQVQMHVAAATPVHQDLFLITFNPP